MDIILDLGITETSQNVLLGVEFNGEEVTVEKFLYGWKYTVIDYVRMMGKPEDVEWVVLPWDGVSRSRTDHNSVLKELRKHMYTVRLLPRESYDQSVGGLKTFLKSDVVKVRKSEAQCVDYLREWVRNDNGKERPGLGADVGACWRYLALWHSLRKREDTAEIERKRFEKAYGLDRLGVSSEPEERYTPLFSVYSDDY